ncbi:hypothetical protein PMAYCL1PPCAC_05407 [Pristionchus mayeri]|uniref:PAP-associated domain-containing protein n=1 Tax=Pristionchus mayeri TaxID=1317129 RepID=A0AAN4Z637_9BILA|nr:hypothetical protein PMAYCL1PPCAC_05407 [Pristionchus mayeri]
MVLPATVSARIDLIWTSVFASQKMSKDGRRCSKNSLLCIRKRSTRLKKLFHPRDSRESSRSPMPGSPLSSSLLLWTVPKSTGIEYSFAIGIICIQFSISCYNELAVQNSKLLRRYCEWTKDDLLAKLGVFIKRWAKEVGICDASKGSLRSYMILLIHFLQRLQPHPLLPMLQEMGEKKEILVEGWNVYFCDEAPMPDWSKCTLSVGELFLQFLDYFAKFDWENQVIQIRQTNMVTKIQRGWTKQQIMCIEDPFAFDRNLGYRITNRMFTFIINSFVASHEVFSYFSDDSIARFGNSLLAKCRESAGEAPCSNFNPAGPAPRHHHPVVSGAIEDKGMEMLESINEKCTRIDRWILGYEEKERKRRNEEEEERRREWDARIDDAFIRLNNQVEERKRREAALGQ